MKAQILYGIASSFFYPLFQDTKSLHWFLRNAPSSKSSVPFPCHDRCNNAHLQRLHRSCCNTFRCLLSNCIPSHTNYYPYLPQLLIHSTVLLIPSSKEISGTKPTSSCNCVISAHRYIICRSP